MARSEHQRVAAALAEADHADLARAVVSFGKPVARGVEVAERLRLHTWGSRVSQDPPVDGPDLADEGDHAGDPPPPVVEVRRHGEVSLARQPVRLVSQVAAHAKGVVDNNDTRPGTRAGRRGQVRGHLAARRGDPNLSQRAPHEPKSGAARFATVPRGRRPPTLSRLRALEPRGAPPAATARARTKGQGRRRGRPADPTDSPHRW